MYRFQLVGFFQFFEGQALSDLLQGFPLNIAELDLLAAVWTCIVPGSSFFHPILENLFPFLWTLEHHSEYIGFAIR